MRALSGAIITAGALFGLGLAAIGVGERYQGDPTHATVVAERAGAEATPKAEKYVHFKDLDTPMMYLVVVLTLALLIGLGVTFVGLMYEHEHLHWHRHRATAGVPGDAGYRPVL